MNEKLIFGIIIPVVIFLISAAATLLIYRRFARQTKFPEQKAEPEKK